MAQKFFFKARDEGGRQIAGRLEAAGRREAVDLLSERGLCVVDLRELSARSFFDLGSLFAPKVGNRELAMLCEHLAVMLKIGMPLLQGFGMSIKRCENRTLERTLKQVAAHLEDGMSLAAALKLYPKVFPPLMTSMVAAGEVSGRLEEVLSRIAAHLQKDYELRENIKSAVFYPAVVLTIAVLSAVVLLTLVVPRFVSLLDNMTLPVPFVTRCVIRCGELFSNYWYLAGLLLLGLIAGCQWFAGTERGRLARDRIALKLPVCGPVIRQLIIARFSWSLGMLLRSGVPVLQSLDVVKNIASNRVVRQYVEEAQNSIKKGESMARPLEQSGFFPPLVTKMIAAGEETGTIGKSLEKIADYYEKEAAEKVKRLAALLEPVLVVCVGSIVGLVMLSVILPLFGIINHIE